MAGSESPNATPLSCATQLHDRLVAVGLVDGADVLHHRREPLEAQARVDVLLRERRQRPVRVLLELHEDEVPELEEAIAARACRRACRDRRSRARPPSPSRSRSRGRTGLGRRQTRSSRRSEARRCARGAFRSPPTPLIATSSGPSLKSGSPACTVTQTRSQSSCKSLLDELGRELDRALLEVLAEREVAEHLEERQVVPVEPDLVDVLRPEALLRGGCEGRRRRLEAEEVRHLRLHAGARQQGRMVVRPRDQRP